MKKVAFLLPLMKGGGAERVAALLANEFRRQGIEVEYLLIRSVSEEVKRCDLSDDIPLHLFTEEMPGRSGFGRLKYRAANGFSSLLCKPFEMVKKPVPAGFARISVVSQYDREIRFLREYLRADSELTLIAFLQPAIPIALLAAKDLPNRVIISERGDPNRLMKKRYGRKFIEKYYPRADAAVFQTEDAKAVYPACIADKGTVIPNPVKPGLPEPYHGKRNRNITTFCRISKQKNLPLLIDAFARIRSDHPEYRLRIIGDASGDEGAEVMAVLKKMIAEYRIDGAVVFEPFSAAVHSMILKDAVYVNSSDYEGISNAMLEAMAIGMPTVCTDCPIGGARATIKDGENGLLVPIKNAAALKAAIERIITDEKLSVRLSENASVLKDRLSVKTISEKWIKLI